MRKPLPELIDPLQLATRGCALQGQIPVSRFKRLAPCLHGSDGSVDVDLKFDIGAGNQAYIAGKLQVSAVMICQRCLQPMAWNTTVSVSLAIVSNELQADKLSSQYEPLLVSDEPMSLIEIVEDEIVLALPPVPLHVPSECAEGDRFRPKVAAIAQSEIGNVEGGIDLVSKTTGKKNPFLVLAQLKKNKTENE